MSGRIGSFLSAPIKTENMPPCLLHELQSFCVGLIMQHYAIQDTNVPVALLTKLQDQENKHTKMSGFICIFFLQSSISCPML